MKKTSAIIFLVLLFSSCNELEKKIEGYWVIDNACINNTPVLWNYYSNGFELKSDKTCFLPINDFSYRNSDKETGKWSAYEEKDKSYLKIETTNEIFNRNFEIKNIRIIRDSISWGNLLKMTLISDSLKLDCTKALY